MSSACNEEEAEKDAAARAELVAGLEGGSPRATRRWAPARASCRLLKRRPRRRLRHRPRQGRGRRPLRRPRSCCARTRRSPPSRSFCDTCNLLAVEDAFKTAKALRRHPPEPLTRPTPASAATSSGTFSARGPAQGSSSTVSRRAIAGSEWQRIVDDLAVHLSRASRSNRMAVGRCDAPLRGRPSPPVPPAPSAPLRRRSSRRRCARRR